MKKAYLLSLLVLMPVLAFGQTIPTIERVEIAGISDQTLSVDLRDSVQKLVGQPNSAAAVDPIIRRIETEHPELVVATRSIADTAPGSIRLVFVMAAKPASKAPADSNVNSQYIVETVDVNGLTRAQYNSAIYDQMQTMIGQQLDHMKIEDLRARLRSEPQLKGKYTVSDRIERGTQPGHVKLVFDAKKVNWAFSLTIGNWIDLNGSGSDGVNDSNDTDIVESAAVTGVPQSAISNALYSDVQKMAGKSIDRLEISRLKEKLESELKNRYSVAENIRKGTKPNTVHIDYVVKQIPWIPERTFAGVGAYHPKQGISLFLDGKLDDLFTLGAGSDGDTLTERYKGFMAGLESQTLGTRHLGAKLQFETFGIRWKSQTLQALQLSPDMPGAYRSRQSIQPSVAFAFNRTLFATAGLNFTELHMMSPALHWESAHEATASIRYKSPTLKHGKGTHEFTSGYEIRSAARNLNSDFVYTRHFWDGSYQGKSSKSTQKVSLMAGKITGNPPLFERFSLGNTTTLRGWNKYDIDPLGGTRVVHVSTEWCFDDVGVFMDNGAVWNAGDSAKIRTSLGVTLGPLKLAFPIRCSSNCGLSFLIHFD